MKIRRHQIWQLSSIRILLPCAIFRRSPFRVDDPEDWVECTKSTR